MAFNFKSLIVFIILLFTNSQAFATHIAGGNITYEPTGNPNEYEITLTLYRDCNGVGAPNNPNIVFSNSCGLGNPPNLILTLDNVLTAEISQLCPSAIGQSTCAGGNFPGYEQYIYTGLVTLTGPCDSWALDYNVCDRNPSTNLVGTSNCFHITSTIYSATAPNNSSPEIVTNYPIPYVCNGQPVNHDFGVVEGDGNTLQFSFVNALGTGASNLTYQAGYTAASPIPGINIDPSTGLLTFTPTLVGNFVVTVLIEELDAAGNVVGSMIHDIQFVVENCVNQGVQPPPNGTVFNGFGTNAVFSGGNTVAMCDGDQFCLDFTFTDPDVTDILYLGTNAIDVLPGATFTQTGTNPATATLCWTYQDGYTANLISITATDSACPTISNASFLLNLIIPPPLNASSDVTICGDQLANLQAFGTPPVTWSVISGDPLNIGTNFTCNPCTTPIATPGITTMYEVTEGSNCQLVDTILVTVVQNQGGITSVINTTDTTLCSGECFNVDAIAEEQFSGVTQTPFNSSTVMNINSNQTITSNLNVAGLNMANMSVGSIQSVCFDLDHTYDSDLDIFLVCPDGTLFELNTDIGGGGNDFTNTCYTIDAVVQISAGSAPFTGNFVPEGGVLSSAMVGCTANGVWGLQITDDAGGDTGTLYSWSIIFNDDIPSNGPATNITWSNTAGMTDPSSATSEICPTMAGEYILYTYNIDNCWASDTLNIAMALNADAGIDSIINLCLETPQVDMFSYLGGTPDVGGLWHNSNGDLVPNMILADSIVSGSVYEYIVGGIGCTATAYITVNVIELTATSNVTDSDCQLVNGIIDITAQGNLGPIQYGINGGLLQASNIFSSLLGASPVGLDYTILVQDSLGCQTTLIATIDDINPPIINNVTVIDNICNGGSIGNIVVIGNNLNFFSIDGGMNIQVSNTFSNLSAGTYTITAYSSDPLTTNACFTIENNIVITEPNALTITIDIPNVTTICPSDNIAISAVEGGGLGNTVLTWNNGSSDFATGSSISEFPLINTQYCVTITEGNCPSATDCIDILMPTPIEPLMMGNVLNGCFPLTVEFTNTSTNQVDIATTEWSLSPSNDVTIIGNASTINTYTTEGVFDISMTITSIYGCIYEASFNEYIETYGYPNASYTYTPIPPTIYDPQVQLTSLSSGDVTAWNWQITGGQPISSSEENVEVIFPEGIPGIYPVLLTVENEHGCKDSLLSQVEVINDVIIYAPNVFTPDGDEYNETWRVYINGIDIYDYHLTIFNRWGETIWESYDPTAGWDGTYVNSDKVLDDTFVWVINAKDTYNDKKYEFKGTVTVLK